MSYTTSDVSLKALIQSIEEVAVEAAWRQWGSLGAGALLTPTQQVTSIIDLEALVLLSLLMQDHERRLGDFVGWCAEVGAPYLSVQRITTLLTRFPEPAKSRFADFARMAAKAGDKRWRRHASEISTALQPRSGKGAATPQITGSSTLMLQLRMGIGVGARADILSYLLGIGGRAATVLEISEATGYTRVAIRNVARSMVLARLLRETTGHPSRYSIEVAPWVQLLGKFSPTVTQRETPPPVWRYWPSVYAFLTQSHHLLSKEISDENSTYVISSRARDLFEQHHNAFEKNQILVPDPKRYRGAAYLEGFSETVHSLATWMVANL